jgi:major vault protein
LDQNTNVTRLEVGPKTFVKQDNETVIIGPEKMITVPYVISFYINKTEKIII